MSKPSLNICKEESLKSRVYCNRKKECKYANKYADDFKWMVNRAHFSPIDSQFCEFFYLLTAPKSENHQKLYPKYNK